MLGGRLRVCLVEAGCRREALDLVGIVQREHEVNESRDVGADVLRQALRHSLKRRRSGSGEVGDQAAITHEDPSNLPERRLLVGEELKTHSAQGDVETLVWEGD